MLSWLRQQRVRRVIPLLVLLAVVGCGKVTRDNNEKVKVGMTRAEIEAILGKGTELAVSEVPFKEFQQNRLGPPKPGEDPADMPSLPGLPPMKDLKEKTTWVRWGNDKKYILIGFLDDKAVAKSSRIPY